MKIGAFKFLLVLLRPQASAVSFIQIDPGFALGGLCISPLYILGLFYAIFPQVLRGSRKCWHLRGASRPTSLTGERCFGGRCLQCASSAALPYRWRIFPPPIRLSRSMLAAYSCEQFWTHFPCEVRPPVCPNGRSLSCSEDTPACASRV